MVFESLVVDVLNKYVLDRYLKPFVKKLDTSQLKVGVLKGEFAFNIIASTKCLYLLVLT